MAQADLHWQDPEANFRSLGTLIGERDRSADLVVLPEMFPTGFTMDPHAVGTAVGPLAAEYLGSGARRSGAAYCGSTPYYRAAAEAFVNRMVLARPDGTTVRYDKRHRFSMAGEDRAYAPGDTAPVIAEVAGWRLLLQICYDLRFPVFSRNRPDAGAYDAIVYVANWPAPRREHWTTLLRARAIENQAYVIGLNRVGIDGLGLVYSGDSVVLDPLGEALLELGGERAAGAAVLSRARLREVRESLPFLRDADAFSLVPEVG